MNDRRRTPRVPTYRKHKPSGQAVVTINGKDCYLGRHGTAASREKYARLIAEWLERGQQTPVSNPGRANSGDTRRVVNDVILSYARHALDYYRDSPAERVRIKLALRPLRKLYGRADVTTFGPLAFKAVQAEMAKSLARRTVNQRAGVIKRMFRWAAGNEIVPAGTYEALRAVDGLRKGRSAARETEPVRPVPDDLVEKTLPFINHHICGMIQFQRLTGARSGEVCIMRPGDIDRTGTVWAYRPSTHKTAYRSQDRVIYVGPRAQMVLAAYLDIPPDEFVFSPTRMTKQRYEKLRRDRRSKVPPSQISRKRSGAKRRPGERYSPQSYYSAIRKACERAGVKHWHPHQLRHAAATELRKRYGIEAARIILGQRHLNTTELYAQQDSEVAHEAMAALG